MKWDGGDQKVIFILYNLYMNNKNVPEKIYL